MKHLAACLALASALFCPAVVQAQSAETVRAVVREFLRGQTAGTPGDVRIEVTAPSGALAPCDDIEPWLPAGTRAWGRIRVGVRCAGDAAWTQYVAAHVRVFGSYLTSARALRPGEILAAGDIGAAEGELTDMGRHLLTDPQQAIGAQMRFAVAQGQPLRATMLATPQVVRSGRPVTVVVETAGFRAANTGTAMNNARPGEGVRVRMGSGKIVHGVANERGEVLITP